MSNKHNKHKQQLYHDHSTHIPRFLQGLINPNTGRANDNLQPHNTTNRTIKRKSINETMDVLPSIVNLDEFNDHDKQQIMMQLGIDDVTQLEVIANNINNDTADIPDTNTSDPTSINTDHIHHNQRIVLDADIDKLVYRPLINKSTDTKPTDKSLNHKKSKPNKSKLAFDM